MKKSNLLVCGGIIIASIFACMNQVNAADDNGGDAAVPEEIFPTEPVLCVEDDGGNDAFPKQPFPIETVLCAGNDGGDE